MTVEYTEELADKICNRLIEGESMIQIGKDPKMPSRCTILRWLVDIPSFETKHARARVLQAEVAHDDMIQIERDTLSGRVDYSVARVVLGSKQWRAAKLSPKKFGDKQEQPSNTPNELRITVEGGFAKKEE
jgi:hypothetical protein